MDKLTVKVPGWPTMRSDGSIKRREDTNIRVLFTNVGIPGYFTLAQEIPPTLFDSPVPESDYWFVIQTEQASRADLKIKKVLLPSIDQVLWALGFMSVELENVIGLGAIRFMHRPFRAHLCCFRTAEAWRQVVVRRTDQGYSVGTACVAKPEPNALFGYLSVGS